MVFQVDGYSDIGNYRKENQDCFWVSAFKSADTEMVSAVVCDGMGGLEDGFFASSLVVRRVSESVKQGKFHIYDIENACMRAHQELKARGKQSGTTMSYLWTDGKRFEITHIGDSRIYKVVNSSFEQLTEDHSVIAEAERRGVTLTNSQLSEVRGKLTRCIGMPNDVIFYHLDGNIDGKFMFMLCSDGFWHRYSGDTLLTGDLEYAVSTCILSGERDNITVVTVKGE